MIDLEISHPFEPVERLDDLRRRSLPLDRRGRQDDANAASPKRYLGDVVDRCAGGARHDPDDMRVARQRTLPIGVKQALTEQLVLQVFERLEQCAATRGARHVADELQPPARGPDGGAPAQLNAGAVDDQKTRSDGGRAVHHAIDNRVLSLVLEGEIDMPARGGLGARHLADHPHVERGPLDRALQSPIEIGHRIDEDLFGRGHGAEPSTT